MANKKHRIQGTPNQGVPLLLPVPESIFKNKTKRSISLAKPLVAVFDSSREYVDRFLAYVKKKRGVWFEVVGFTDEKSLAEYLSKNRVQILLYSQEEFVEDVSKDGQCDPFIDHPHVGTFIYLGKRRNSRSRLKHIEKYQSMENILSELNQSLDLQIEDHREAWKGDIKIIGIYSPAPGPATLPVSLRIANGFLAGGSVLYVNLDRFSLLGQQESIGSGISDLIFFYRTNKEQITQTLKRSKERRNGFDLLCASCDMEDIEEIRPEEWQDFLYELAIRGEYNVLILDMYEAFRNLEEIFSICDEIYIPAGNDLYARQKTEKMKQFLLEKGRSDLLEKMTRICTEDFNYDIN